MMTMHSLHTIYQRNEMLLIWKPRSLASSRGPSDSLLDLIQQQLSHPGIDDDIPDQIATMIQSHLTTHDRHPTDRLSSLHTLTETFSHDQEYGLLNRLDTPTGGRLTFATTPDAKLRYLDLQAQGYIQKSYLAIVSGQPHYLINHPESLPDHTSLKQGDDSSLSSGAKRRISGIPNQQQNSTSSGVEGNKVERSRSNQSIINYSNIQSIHISTPLMHHRHLDNRMIAVRSESDRTRGRGKLLDCTTTLTPLSYDSTPDQSLLHCTITQGQRHQIRVHCQTLGYPLIGDTIYGRDKDGGLQLWCMGYHTT